MLRTRFHVQYNLALKKTKIHKNIRLDSIFYCYCCIIAKQLLESLLELNRGPFHNTIQIQHAVLVGCGRLVEIIANHNNTHTTARENVELLNIKVTTTKPE
jgi:hypothetical protein